MSSSTLTLEDFITDDVIQASEANGLDLFAAQWLRENPRKYGDLWRPNSVSPSRHYQNFIQACPVASVLEMFAAKVLGRPADGLQVHEAFGDINRRVDVAKNKRAPFHVLKELSRDGRVQIRKAVASNPGAPAAILSNLAHDWHRDVRGAVADNPSTPTEVLSGLANDKDPQIRAKVARNERLSRMDMEDLAQDPDRGVRSAATGAIERIDTPKFKTPTELVSDATAKLVAALNEGKSEALRNYLAAMARFRSYSFSNVLLIITQKPHATRVAGFNTWKEMGRRVKKGEKGIKILAPMFRNKRQENAEDAAAVVTTSEKRLSGFRSVTVFDQSQTEGRELPAYEGSEVEGDVSECLPLLRKFVSSLSIKLSYEADMVAEGLSKDGEIVLREGMSDAHTFSVLVHEVAHELLHKGARRAETTKTVRETEAEAVAFIVCTALGLQVQNSSSDYIQMYNGDSSVLLESLAAVQQTANRILCAISEDQEAATEYSVAA